ncbi:MAG: hypothetical protein ACRECX_13510 [Methyloceanibacter sp.]|uniref:hypothetical protein n=1 Tax=Methyloceanibacter sp. TaxID=1965321 RepID=UPI003D6CB207
MIIGRWVAAGFVLLVIFVAVGIYWEPPSTLSALQPPPGQPITDAEVQKEPHPFIDLLNDNDGAVLAILTFFLVIFTAVLADVGHQQIRQTEILQRAYLWIDIGNIRALTGEDGFVPRIIIRNAGRHPAENVAWAFGEPHFTSNNVWRPDKYPDAPTGSVTLAPGAEMTHGAPVLHIPSEHRGQSVYLYIWGYVTYDDGFRTGRIARFSHRYNMKLIRPVEGLGRRAFPKMAARFSRDYNEST